MTDGDLDARATPADDRWLYGWGAGYVAVGAASLLVPLYALALGGGPLLVGLLASTAAFAGVPGAVLWGWLATRTERRLPFLATTLGVVAGALALAALLSRPWLLLVPNAALWFVVAAATPVVTLVMVEDRAESAWEAQLGRLNAYQGYGWLGGLVAGSLWMTAAPRLVGERAAFRLFLAVAAATTLLALAYVRRTYPEPATGGHARSAVRELRRVARRQRPNAQLGQAFTPFYLVDRLPDARALGRFAASATAGGLRTYLLAATLFFLGFAVFFGPLPAYLTATGYGSDRVFVLFAVASAGSAVFYGRTARFAERVELGRLHAGALAVRGGSLPAVALAARTDAFGLLLALFALLGVAWAVIAVTAAGLVTRLARSAERARALGTFTALAGVGTGVGSAVGGALATAVGYVTAFGAAAALVFAGATLALVARRATPATGHE